MTFDATVNPVVYEGGIPVFIDTERDSWNIDVDALIEFSNNLYMQSNDITKYMHALAKNYFDWEFTMRELLDYLEL
jgi:hypothetical protein